jgi:hypothetical protein
VTRSTVAALLLLALARRAEADCAADADRLRAHLVAAAPGVHRWNLGWALGFGGAAVAQFALAATKTNPFGTFTTDYEETLYVGAIKSSIGALSRIVQPLRVIIPPPNADRCADLKALRDSLSSIARNERNNFWLTHLGGLALNLTGGFILWHRRSFRVGATSFVMSYPVGPAAAYTMPRGSWHLWRDESPTWSVAVGLGHDQATLSLVGQL